MSESRGQVMSCPLLPGKEKRSLSSPLSKNIKDKSQSIHPGFWWQGPRVWVGVPSRAGTGRPRQPHCEPLIRGARPANPDCLSISLLNTILTSFFFPSPFSLIHRVNRPLNKNQPFPTIAGLKGNCQQRDLGDKGASFSA